jgi:hypothetical protein
MNDMLEHRTITLPKSMPLDERIAKVGKLISEWLNSLDDIAADETGRVFLTKYEIRNNEYSYRYSIINPKNN